MSYKSKQQLEVNITQTIYTPSAPSPADALTAWAWQEAVILHWAAAEQEAAVRATLPADSIITREELQLSRYPAAEPSRLQLWL